MSGPGRHSPALWKRLAWMAGIWGASVAVVVTIAWIIRLFLAP